MAQTPIKKKVVIIGAGFGGLGMAVALMKAGVYDFIILEEGCDIGGVWRNNKYPGCTCDVPSHLYSFSFAPYRRRDLRYPPQQSILTYLQEVATQNGLLNEKGQQGQRLSLNTKVLEANFQEEAHCWDIITVSQRYRAEIVIFAVGQLHKPNYPSGHERFAGPKFHSAEWNNSIGLVDKHISVIGTGSSAAQMLPTLAKYSSKLTVFQRTPQWVLPKPDLNFSCMEALLLRIPGAHQLYRKFLSHGADMFLSPVTRSNVWRNVVQRYAEYNLCRQVADEKLLKQLTPSYSIGCKRILFDNHFYSTLAQEKVELVTDPIVSFREDGIVTKGENGEVVVKTDVIIYATGFKASEFLNPMSVQGWNGHTLEKDWAAGAEAFLGLAIHGYPNLFMIAGPNSFNPAGSNPEMKELQIAYIVKCITWKERIGAKAIEVSREATSQYQKWLSRKMKQTVWQEPVDSWYKHESGKVTSPWPESLRVFSRMLQRNPQDSFKSVE